MISNQDEVKSYTPAEQVVIDHISESVRVQRYSIRGDDEIFMTLSMDAILASLEYNEDALIDGLDSLRKRSFKVQERNSISVNGMIMRAKVLKMERVVEVLIGKELAYYFMGTSAPVGDRGAGLN